MQRAGGEARAAKAEAASGGWGKGNRGADWRTPIVSGSRKEGRWRGAGLGRFCPRQQAWVVSDWLGWVRPKMAFG